MNSDPRYLKDVTVGSSASTIFTVEPVSFAVLGKYSFCSADIQPMPLKHNSPRFHVFFHFDKYIIKFLKKKYQSEGGLGEPDNRLVFL